VRVSRRLGVAGGHPPSGAEEIIWAEPGELQRSTYKGQVFERLYEQQ